MKKHTLVAAATSLALALTVPVLGASAPASADTPDGWVAISSGPAPSSTARTGVHRTPDGRLHVAYVRPTPDHAGALAHAALDPTGTAVTTRQDIVTGWAGLHGDPELIADPAGGLQAVFSGIYSTTTGAGGIFAGSRLYHAVSDPPVSSWTLPAESIGRANGAGNGGYGLDALTLPDGRPFGVWSHIGSRLVWFAGTTTDPGSEPADPSYSPPGGAQDPSLARVGDAVYAAWTNHAGTHVKQIHPVLGPDRQAPGASTVGATSGHDVAVATSSTGHLYLAYQSADGSGVRLWNVTTDQVAPIPASNSRWAMVAISPGEGGRMWVAWKSEYGEASVVRSNPTGTAFGVPVRVTVPDEKPLSQLALAAGPGYADVVANSHGIWAKRVRPVPQVHVKAKRRPGTSLVKVRATVTDAGVAVPGARVAAGRRRSCSTDAEGTCVFRVQSRRRQLTVTVSSPGHATTEVRLKLAKSKKKKGRR